MPNIHTSLLSVTKKRNSPFISPTSETAQTNIKYTQILTDHYINLSLLVFIAKRNLVFLININIFILIDFYIFTY